MQKLEINLLGSPQVIVDGNAAKTDRRKAIGLLAYLAVEAGEHTREQLAALLWPDYPHDSAFSYLRRTVWELNQMLGKGWVESDRETISLIRSASLLIDVEQFEQLAAAGDEQLDALEKAARLYRGDFIHGLVIADTAPYQAWQEQQAAHYKHELCRVLEQLVVAYEGRGEYSQALSHAERWLALDSLDEAAHRAVMRQHAGMGDRSRAIRAYQACVQTLKDELGVPPQEETEQLYQSILHEGKVGKPNKPGKTALTGSETSRMGYLPIPSTPFIGRLEELDQLRQLVLDPKNQLLSLVGPGGNGKTRLAIQAASELAPSFTDGAWFVSLAALQSPLGLVEAMGKGLGFTFHTEEETPHQQLMDFLRQKQMLVILDNFEHLVEGGTELVMDILQAAPRVKLVVTSRERLNLQAEQVYRVPGMRIPDQQAVADWDDPEAQARPFSSIQLLRERAQRVRSDFQLTCENIVPVMKICQLVDGSPLGIELAVSWLTVLPEDELAREISRNLDFLESTASDTPSRQRSLRAVFDTSWKLLQANERQAFQRLCVFTGSFSNRAALLVSGASMRTLLSLANKSWLEQSRDGRYHLHQVLRQYGMQGLEADQAEWTQARDRHAEYFANFVQVQKKALRTAGQIEALDLLKPELENNIPEAWAWLVMNGQQDIVIDKILPGLFHYWLIHPHSDEFIQLTKNTRRSISSFTDHQHILQTAIIETLETSMEMNYYVYDDQPKERLDKLWKNVHEHRLETEMGFWYTVLIFTYGGLINAEGFQKAIELIPRLDEFPEAWERGYIYTIASKRVWDKPALRKEYLDQALRIFEQLGVVHEKGFVLNSLGDLASSQLDYQMAIEYTREALSYYEQVADNYRIDGCLTSLGEYYIYLGRIEQAFEVFGEIRRIRERSGNLRLLGNDMSWESIQASRYRSLEDALELRKRSLEIALEVGNQNDIGWHTWELGEIYRLMGDVEQARSNYIKALPWFEKTQELIGQGFYHRGLGDIAMLEGKWEHAREEYEASLAYHEKDQRSNRNWGLAVANTRMGIALISLGELDLARQHLKTALKQAVWYTNPDLKAVPLEGIAAWLAATGKPEMAIEVAECVASQPTTWNEVKKQAREVIQAASKLLGDEEFQAARNWGEGMTIDGLCIEFEEL